MLKSSLSSVSRYIKLAFSVILIFLVGTTLVNSAFQCKLCPENHWCAGGIKTPCPEGKVTIGTQTSSPSGCITCAEKTYNTAPVYDNGTCVTCESKDASKPFWNGNECVACDEDENSETPYWSEHEGRCISCVVGSSVLTPYWNPTTRACEACPNDNPKWNGTNCEPCPSGQTYIGNGICALATAENQCGEGFIPIYTAQDLAKIGVDPNYTLSKNYCLMNDISLIDYQSDGGWVPIGNYKTYDSASDTNKANMNPDDYKFTGIFDGNNHIISDLKIKCSSSSATCSYQGLFGYTYGAKIRNLGLANLDIYAYRYTGGLVAYNSSTSITNCYAEGTIYAQSYYVGGLVGHNTADSPVSDSHFDGDVYAHSGYVGGLIGINYSPITNSYSTGSVKSRDHHVVGGLVGLNQNNGRITNCYSTSSVSAKLYSVGGLVGENYSAITNTYATGDVSGTEKIGGLVGANYSSITNSFALGSISGTTSVGGLIGYHANNAITNSYSTGVVTGTTNVGGFVGYNYGSGSNISASYFSTTSSGLTTACGLNEGTCDVVGKSVSEMMALPSESVYVAWPTDNWCFSCSRYPLLKNMPAGAFDATSCDTEDTCAISKENCPTTGYYSDGFACEECPLNSYCADRIQEECPLATPATENKGSSSISQCKTCAEVNINTPVWDDLSSVSGCISCLEYSSDTPYWNTATKACEACPADTPYWNGSSCTDTCGDGLCVLTAPLNTCEAGYILIRTADELAKIGYDPQYPLSGSYCLVNDISLVDYQSGEGWVPIGNYDIYSTASTEEKKNLNENDYQFTGIFDGNNHVVTDLYINCSAKFQGFFGRTKNATIRNIGIIDVNITSTYTGQTFVGGLAGSAASTTVTNSYSTGVITGAAYIGGLVGSMGGYLKNSYSNSKVNGGAYIGGLLGGGSGTIENCYAIGSVTSSNIDAGGLIGHSSGTVSNSYANVIVTGNKNVGGLIGENSSAAITNCYSTSVVEGNTNASGFIGVQGSRGSVSGSYFNKTVSRKTNACGNKYCSATGKTTSAMYSIPTSSIYTGWDTDIWCFNCAKYPVLKNMPAGAPTTDSCDTTSCTNTDLQCDTDGYYHDGYSCVSCEIGSYCAGGVSTECPSNTPATLSTGAVSSTECRTCASINANTPIWNDLAATVGCSSCYEYNSETPYWNGSSCSVCPNDKPIWNGSECEACPDGQTHLNNKICVLSDAINSCEAGFIAINTPQDLAKIGVDTNYPLNGKYCLMSDISLADYQDGEGWAPIGNYAASSSNIFTGVFDGNGHEVSDLYINRSSKSYQGLFGYATGATIRNIRISGNVTGNNYTGAVAGYIKESTVTNSHSAATISGGSNLGGLVGYSITNSVISYSSSTSDIIARIRSSAGGLLGYNSGSTVTNSFAAGDITTNSISGGLIGTNTSSSTVTNCYATGSIFKTGTNAFIAGASGGLVATNTSSSISNCYSAGSIILSSNSISTVYFGGLVGSNSGTITNSYSSTIILGPGKKGGLVGNNSAATSSITNSYYNATTSVATDACYNNAGTCEAVGKTNEEMFSTPSDTIYTGWSEDTWCFSCAKHPVLKDMPEGAFDATLCDTEASCSSSFDICTDAGYYNNGFECAACALNFYCTNGVIEECPSDRPATATTGTTNETGCMTCPNINGNTPIWDDLASMCRSCVEIDKTKPYWNSKTNSCEACPEDTPIWNSTNNLCEYCALDAPFWDGTKCIPCPITHPNQQRFKCLECPEDKPYWDGEACVASCTAGKACYLTKAVNSCEAGYISITSGSDLARIGNDENYPLNGKYCLMNDISLADYQTGEGWVPIGNYAASSSNKFTGIFDGNGHEVSDLYIKRTSSTTGKYQGLFGLIEKATIRNIGVSGNVEAYDYVGGLVGFNISSSIISNSYATGSVTGTAGGACVGGLVGYNNSSSISNSYATGSVTGTAGGAYVGGLVGFNISSSIISNSYATGSVTGTAGGAYVGGLVGHNRNSATISNSYSTALVTGSSAYVGGLVGYNSSSSSKVTSSYYNITNSLQKAACGTNLGTCDAVGKTTQEMLSIPSDTIYVGWSADAWCFSCKKFPVLKNMPANAPSADACDTDSTCSASVDFCAADGYTSNGFECVTCPLNAYCPEGVFNECPSNKPSTTTTGVVSVNGCQACEDINPNTPAFNDFSGSCSTCYDIDKTTPHWNGTSCEACPDDKPYFDGAKCVDSCADDKACYLNKTVNSCEVGYIPITSGSDLARIGNNENYPLNGKYCLMNDISLSAYQTGEGWVPIGNSTNKFIGVFDGNGHEVSDLYINRTNSSTGIYQGLFGYTNGAKIRNLGVRGNVNGYSSVGILIGNAYTSSIIDNCHSAGMVTGTNDDVGGLVGVVAWATISNSYSTGSVVATANAGGLVGDNFTGSTISNSYATGSVTSTGSSARVGGLAGNNGANIFNSYATGSVTGTGSSARVGGLVGYSYVSQKISNSYATGSVTGTGSDAKIGGLVGYNHSTITNSFSTGLVTGSGSYVGGLVGYNDSSSAKITASYFNTTTSGSTTACGSNSGTCDATGKTTDEMKVTPSDSVYVGWSTDMWCFSCVKFPVLKNMPESAYDATICDADSTCSTTGSSPFCESDGSYNNGFACLICPFDSYCVAGGIEECPSDKPATSTTGSTSIDACTTCVEVNGANKPQWNDLVGACTSCVEYDNTAPKWTGTACSSCYDHDKSKPVWNGSDCEACPTDKPYWNLETSSCEVCPLSLPLYDSAGKCDACPDATPYWNGTECIADCTSGYCAMNKEIGTCELGSILIFTADDLAKIGVDEKYPLSADYCLMNDISLSTYQAGTGWTPIAFNTDPYVYSGIFDGNGHTISNLLINHTSIETDQGLFAALEGGTIRNLNVTGKVIVNNANSSYIGGIVGAAEVSSTLSNVSFEGEVYGGSYVGGLAGRVYSSSTVTNSYSKGKVTGIGTAGSTGGLAGAVMTSSTITKSYSAADVTGKTYVGGIAGRLMLSTVSDVYATGAVSGTNYLGGIVGGNVRGKTISNTYSTGSVTVTGTGTATYLGAIAGNSATAIDTSFFDSETSGLTLGCSASSTASTSGICDAVAKTTAEMQTPATFDSWDTTIWELVQGSYPKLIGVGGQ